MHILVIGDIGVGKSTLISKLLHRTRLPVFGFRTEKTDAKAIGRDQVYIHQATGEKTYSDKNTAALCSANGIRINEGVFDNLGAALLMDIPSGSIVLMDELGFIESGEMIFCDAVLRILDGPYFVLAAVKTVDTPFLRSVLSHQNALVFNVNVYNRNTLEKQILDALQHFDPDSPFIKKPFEQ